MSVDYLNELWVVEANGEDGWAPISSLCFYSELTAIGAAKGKQREEPSFEYRVMVYKRLEE